MGTSHKLVCERLHAALKAKGVAQETLAEDLNLSKSTVAKYFSHGTTDGFANRMSVTTLCSLAKYLDCTTDYLLGLSDFRTMGHSVAYKNTPLTQEAIDKLESAQSTKEIKEIQNKKISILNYLAENMNVEPYDEFLNSLYDYLLFDYDFIDMNCTYMLVNGSGKVLQNRRAIKYSELNHIFFSRVLDVILKIKQNISDKISN